MQSACTTATIFIYQHCARVCSEKFEDVGDEIVEIELPAGECEATVCIYAHDGAFRQAEPAPAPGEAGCISSDNQRCMLCSYQTTVRRPLLCCRCASAWRVSPASQAIEHHLCTCHVPHAGAPSLCGIAQVVMNCSALLLHLGCAVPLQDGVRQVWHGSRVNMHASRLDMREALCAS